MDSIGKFFADVNTWFRCVLFGEIMLDDTLYPYVVDRDDQDVHFLWSDLWSN
jgi:hypothetical protein